MICLFHNQMCESTNLVNTNKEREILVVSRSLFSIANYRRICYNECMGGGNMLIKESGEMYLETIYVLSQKHPSVRSIDVAEEMNFSKPAVSRAMSKLKENKYIEIGRDGAIVLTESGRALAEKIYERHTLLTNFIMRLGVDEQTAVTDACKIEHDISEKTFEAIKKHALKTEN